MNKFLTKYDFETLIDEKNIDEITDSNDRTLFDSIDEAIEEVAGYIRHRYDFDKVFRVVIPYADLTAFVIDDRVYWSETAYDPTAEYVTGDRISESGNIYEANQTVPAEAFDASKWSLLAENNSFYTCTAISTGNLPTDTDYFSVGDNRNSKIKQVTIDVTLYNIHSKITTRNIPDVRRVRYDGFGNKNDSENAIRYLEKVQKGQITPNLPVIEPDTQSSQRIAYGVTSNSNHNY